MERNHDYCEDNNTADCFMGYLRNFNTSVSERKFARGYKSAVYATQTMVYGNKRNTDIMCHARHNRKRCVSAVF